MQTRLRSKVTSSDFISPSGPANRDANVVASYPSLSRVMAGGTPRTRLFSPPPPSTIMGDNSSVMGPQTASAAERRNSTGESLRPGIHHRSNGLLSMSVFMIIQLAIQEHRKLVLMPVHQLLLLVNRCTVLLLLLLKYHL